jgi:hypothetical protein
MKALHLSPPFLPNNLSRNDRLLEGDSDAGADADADAGVDDADVDADETL